MSLLTKITGTAKNRPDSIAVLCILLALWSASRLLYFAFAFIETSELMSLVGTLLSLSILISVSALWRMKLWGLYLFLLTLALNGVLLQLIPADLPVKGAIRMGGTAFLAVIYMIIVLPHKQLLTRKDSL